MLIAGDDVDAESALTGIGTSGGLNATAAGPLTRARGSRLPATQPRLAANEKISWTGDFGVVPDPDPARRSHTDRSIR